MIPEVSHGERALHTARAAVLRDLDATGHSDPATVSSVDDAVAGRRWWVEQWPDGAAFLTALVAQDVADALLEKVGRWPRCRVHDEAIRPSGEAMCAEAWVRPPPTCGWTVTLV